MSAAYDRGADYDDEALGACLRLIAARCPDLAAGAVAALGVSGASRQIRYDQIVTRALSATDAWSEDEREQLGALAWQGVMRDDGAQRRVVPIQIKVTQDERERIGAAADTAGLTLSEWVRRRLLLDG